MSSNLEKSNPGRSCEFQENLNILRQISIFSPLPLDSLKVFAYLCNRERFKKGDFLFKQDEDDGQAFYIISGEAVLVYKGETELMPRILHALVDRIYRWEKKLLADHAETCNDCIKKIGVSLV